MNYYPTYPQSNQLRNYNNGAQQRPPIKKKTIPNNVKGLLWGLLALVVVGGILAAILVPQFIESSDIVTEKLPEIDINIEVESIKQFSFEEADVISEENLLLSGLIVEGIQFMSNNSQYITFGGFRRNDSHYIYIIDISADSTVEISSSSLGNPTNANIFGSFYNYYGSYAGSVENYFSCIVPDTNVGTISCATNPSFTSPTLNPSMLVSVRTSNSASERNYINTYNGSNDSESISENSFQSNDIVLPNKGDLNQIFPLVLYSDTDPDTDSMTIVYVGIPSNKIYYFTYFDSVIPTRYTIEFKTNLQHADMSKDGKHLVVVTSSHVHLYGRETVDATTEFELKDSYLLLDTQLGSTISIDRLSTEFPRWVTVGYSNQKSFTTISFTEEGNWVEGTGKNIAITNLLVNSGGSIKSILGSDDRIYTAVCDTIGNLNIYITNT